MKQTEILTSYEFDGCFCHDDDNVYVQFDQLHGSYVYFYLQIMAE